MKHKFSSDSKIQAVPGRQTGDKRIGELQSMSDKIIENNQVTVIGSVAGAVCLS